MPYKPEGRIIRIGVLSNPLSGRNKRHLSSFRSVFQACDGLDHAEVVTPDDISKALRVFASNRVNLVLINGGDGTIQATLGALMHEHPFTELPCLAVLPSGTANLIAGDVGLGPYSPETVSRLLAASTPSAFQTKRHILRIKFSDGRPPLHGMFFGAGAIYSGTQLGRETKQSVGRLGEWGAGLILARFLLALALGSKGGPQPVEIDLALGQSELVNGRYLVLFATTLDRLFLGMKPFWDSQHGPLHYTGLTVPYRYLWRLLPTLLRGKSHPLATKENGYVSQNPQEIRLNLVTGFVLDGEIYDPPQQGQSIVLESAGEMSFVRLQS